MSRRQPRWTLQRRIGVTLGVTITLLLLVVAGSGFRLVQAREQQNHVIGEFYTALRASQGYFIARLDTETAVRGYALTRQRSSLEPMERAGAPADARIVDQVRAQIPEQAESLRLLAVADASARRWYDEWALPAVHRIDRGGVLTVAEVDRGRRLFDRFRADYDAYISETRHGREAASARLENLTNRLFGAVVFIAAIATVGGVLLWWLLRRWVSRPAEQLGREVRQVSEGDLTHPVQVTGPAEFVALGDDVERMRDLLVAQIAAIETANREVSRAHQRLEEQALDLQRSNRDLEQFAYVASHDLQEPLRKVASFCQLLERRYAGQLDERADQYIHFAVDGAKRMQQLINDLLDFSRVGRLNASIGRVELDQCFATAMSNLEKAREHAGATVTADPFPVVQGETGLLTQLMQNLVGNAMKFRSDEPPVVHLGVRRAGDFWEFSCRDNGIGIDPEYGERVFMIFQRLHPKDVYSGTGIGLALCKRIVEYHGGRIWIDTSATGAGTGTTVRWTLPVAEES